jgi:polyisoprenoid-binding protein YceI
MSTVKWVLDPTHSEIFFKVKHLMITNVKGSFTGFNASIDGADFTAAPVALQIDVNTISTNNADRDAHLKSGDFFETEKYPHITFQSTGWQKISEEEYKMTGNLTIKGTTKSITLDVTYGGANKDPWGNDKIGFEVKGKFNRSEFGLNWNSALETGGVLVSDEVKMEAEVQFIKQVEEQA